MGVVGAVTPVTNPIVTPMCNGMFALKTGNAVIFSAHPKAQKCTELLGHEFMEIVRAHGGPDDLVQVVTDGSVEKTQELMQSVDVVVAAGGAYRLNPYSSGKPSFSVGAGNVPVILDRNINLKEAIEKIVAGASFDNGIICYEQFVLAPDEQYEEALGLFLETGKVWYTDTQSWYRNCRMWFSRWKVKQRGCWYSCRNCKNGRNRRSTVTKLIVLRVGRYGRPPSQEKLCPVRDHAL